ncbi:MAG: hypothetical protein HY709_04725, partial [Candidatus Latescibacteria bacterium]|nr:hypothetical protein [Candidatus Latescibacterota bacterium]
MLFLKRQFPLIIAFIVGVAFAVQYYIPHKASEDLFTLITDWMIVVSGFAYFLGFFSLARLHAARIRRKEAGWGFSAVMFLALIVTAVAGGWAEGETTHEGSVFGWIYNSMFYPLT